MKKIFTILILSLLLSYIYCGDSCSLEYETAKGPNDCKKVVLDDDDREKGYTHCCYIELKYKGENTKGCVPLSENDYKDIDEAEKKVNNMDDFDEAQIDCYSYYLKIGLLSLLFIIF